MSDFVVIRADRATNPVVAVFAEQARAQSFAEAFRDWVELTVVQLAPDAYGDFRPGSKPFGVTIARDGTVANVDPRPDPDHFGGRSIERRPQPEDESVEIFCWGRDEGDARKFATEHTSTYAPYAGWIRRTQEYR